MMTLPSRLAHHRTTAPQPCREESQVMTTMWAEPVSSFPSEEGSVEGAGDEGPQGAATGGEVLSDPADEHGGLADGGWEGNDSVEVRVGLGADDGGE